MEQLTPAQFKALPPDVPYIDLSRNGIGVSVKGHDGPSDYFYKSCLLPTEDGKVGPFQQLQAYSDQEFYPVLDIAEILAYKSLITDHVSKGEWTLEECLEHVQKYVETVVKMEGVRVVLPTDITALGNDTVN